MPEAISNNAVCGIKSVNGYRIYSFGGIDDTKKYSGIHDRVYCYNSADNKWKQVASLPNGGGRIAAGASLIKDKVYIVGGYEVFSNGNEKSFSQTHIFDPEVDTFLADAKPIPVPIDDHVQAVWRDSLLYVVTGWSNTTNKNNVQIYNPNTDTWTAGTPVPNNTNYKVFGGSGTIIGDTIYYIGGARIGSSFPATSYFRKGVINPQNPTEITWSGFVQSEAKGYRMAAVKNDGKAIWFGGSKTTYNYDGVAYNGTGVVSPENRIVIYDPQEDSLYEETSIASNIMDFRGAFSIGRDSFIVAGGMLNGAQVTDSVFLIHGVDLHLNTTEEKIETIHISPNPCHGSFTVSSPLKMKEISAFDLKGNQVYQNNSLDETERLLTINISSGIYLVRVHTADNQIFTHKIVCYE